VVELVETTEVISTSSIDENQASYGREAVREVRLSTCSDKGVRMPQVVKGVIARAKNAPVELADVTVPDPGPGEAVVKN